MNILKIGLSLAICFGSSAVVNAESKIEDECTKDLLLSYFPEPFVMQTLERFDVPEEKRAQIAHDLIEQDRKVIQKVEMKAERLDPNPLRDPSKRQEAVKLFRETLFELFAEVLHRYDVKDEAKIQDMLDDIQRQKAEQFARCMEKHTPKIQKEPANIEFKPSNED